MRILVADDFPPWRPFVCSILREAGWQVVGQASDGLEAIQKAQKLQPDVILLDIELPKLNGIEAARQILKLATKSKILFLSVSDSVEIVTEALRTGASGYVVKYDAAGELAKAVEAVVQGKWFVSSRLRGVVALGSKNTETLGCHAVQFYSDDAVFGDRAAGFIGAALKSGNAAIVFATKLHRDSLSERLNAQSLNVDALIRQRAYIVLDAAETLSTFMVRGWPNAALFFQGFSKLIESASKAVEAEQPRVAVCGEAVALLCADGKTEAAIRLEQLGNELAKMFKIDILCAYPFSLHTQEDVHALKAICAEHTAVYWA